MMVDQFWHDLRLACRALLRARGFTGTAVLTLAVGIAGTTVMFALIQGVLLRPLAVRDQGRLLVAWNELRSSGAQHWPFRVTPAEVEQISESSQVFERVAGVGYNGAIRFVGVENGAASYISSAFVTGDFFSVLGVEPILGRAFTPADDVNGAEHVLVITHALWQRRYGGARDVIGRRVIINEQPSTIVGVMPPDVEYPRGVEAWRAVAGFPAMWRNDRLQVDVDVIGRLRPGATIGDAEGELQAVMTRLEQEPGYGGAPRGLTSVVRTYEEIVVGDVRTAMLVLFAAVALVLVIASANVANLLLLRGEARRPELAVRLALGAGRSRLARQLVAESLVLALAAGALGLAVTWWSLQALVALVPDGLPRIESVRIDAGVAAFTMLIAFLAAALAAVVPALSSVRIDPIAQLRSGGRGVTGPAARHGRRTLVVAQVALAVTVVAAAGLLTRSLLRLQTVDMGLAADRMVFVELAVPQVNYDNRVRHIKFLDDVIAALEAAPVVAGATPVHTPPFAGTGGWDVPRFAAEGQTEEQAAANPALNLESIHPNYFDTFEIAIVRGRGFTGADREGAPQVAIVSEDVAARTWPGADPIGKRLKMGGATSKDNWRTVVGIARPTRYRELVEPRATLYLPAEQFIARAHMLVLRTSAPLALIAGLVRERVHAADPAVQVMRVAPFAEMLDGPLARPRFNAFLLSVFGGAALLLAAIGLYAVMAAYVRQRDREIGIRIALGATASDLRRFVLGEGMLLAGLGAAIGLAGAAAATRLLRGLLFAVDPLDPATLLAAALVLVAVSALASYLPARRATRIDPIAMLRAD